MAAAHLQPCFVIHRRDYRNSSLLLELFTPRQGRLPAIARGAKSGRASRAALLQPFRPLQVGISGRGEIKTLNQVEPEGRAFPFTGRILYCGFYLNELLIRLLQRDDPHPNLFAYYLDTLHGLAAGRAVEECLRHFEIRLLQEIGYELVLDREAESGAPIDPADQYDYVIEQGPVRARAGSSASPLRVDGQTLLCLHNREPMEAPNQSAARGLMRAILAFYLGDKPLKSRELFRGQIQPDVNARLQDG